MEKIEGGLEEQLDLLPLDNNEEARLDNHINELLVNNQGVRLMAEELLSNCEATRLHPHHRILMAAKRKVALSPAGLYYSPNKLTLNKKPRKYLILTHMEKPQSPYLFFDF